MPFDVQIRSASCEDLAELDQLFRYLDKFHSEARPDLFREPTGPARDREFLMSILEDGVQKILVAEADEQAVGFIHAVLRSSPLHAAIVSRRYGLVDTLAVLPNFQGRKIGSMLIQASLDWMESREVQDVEISVHEFNSKAAGLYRKFGFLPSTLTLRRIPGADWRRTLS